RRIGTVADLYGQVVALAVQQVGDSHGLGDSEEGAARGVGEAVVAVRAVGAHKVGTVRGELRADLGEHRSPQDRVIALVVWDPSLSPAIAQRRNDPVLVLGHHEGPFDGVEPAVLAGARIDLRGARRSGVVVVARIEPAWCGHLTLLAGLSIA